jgi:hypothetical protein
VPLLSGRTPARAAAMAAFVLHAFAALWVWWRWSAAARGGLLFWMDFPLSVAYAGARGFALLAASVLLGGAWWALVAAALTRLVGSSAHGDDDA